MVYKEFQDKKLSSLGFGAMRLPVSDSIPGTPIDEEKTEEMVDFALRHGVNYFDTAYGYHDGTSEVVMGKVLGKYPRDSYYLATKFPGYDLSNMDKVDTIFEEQLGKCGMEYFDFYLLHNIYEKNIDPYLDPKYGIMDYLLKQKENGRIRHLGFSAHGRYDTMKRFLEAYGDKMEFCQIQLNYLDWKLQDAKAKVELLNEYHIPIWVMEPLRGGKLAELSAENEAKLHALRPEEAVPAWAFRFLQSIPGVTMVLSGMSNRDQLEKNIATFAEDRPLNEEEMTAILEAADSMLDVLPCTACRYCVSHCPKGLDIPTLLSLYNETRFVNGLITHMAVDALDEEKRPDACAGCHSCEAVCPQQLEIAGAMKDFVRKLAQPAGL
ncbi:aldo/keto reductase [[Clostridium] symbiosum]|uniref:aldo/keto reductase n=1 Tax=Clostridium symbiosum TaxID=1512 RepID=UPI0025A45494|nr:aldo/keto reductase [[Clostridium] symbiosum]MDM8134802.1 aldo/keto reductase [[Clostridium] symbiosum]MDM8140242.1 aldo/keto reductase [[Clostridium] symbiosum]MDM8320159.1 aldo/keto reductase [[Clostridium] symbiosum]